MLYIILGIIMVFWAWMQAAAGKLQKCKKDARTQWVRVDALLQTRARYILELLESADQKGFKAGDLLADIYELDGGYCKSDDREVISKCAENVTPLVDRFLELARQDDGLCGDEEFRELEETLAELEEELLIQCERYNNYIDAYNEHREQPGIRLQIRILNPITLKGIHIEPMDSLRQANEAELLS